MQPAEPAVAAEELLEHAGAPREDDEAVVDRALHRHAGVAVPARLAAAGLRLVQHVVLSAAAPQTKAQPPPAGESAAQALGAANELSKQSEMLKAEVDKFMTQMRTA